MARVKVCVRWDLEGRPLDASRLDPSGDRALIEGVEEGLCVLRGGGEPAVRSSMDRTPGLQ
jgi:hypothetical protein